MISNNHWMKQTVKLANKSDGKFIRVAALIVNDNKLIASSFTDSNNSNSWADNLLKDLNSKKVKKVEKLFLTINTIDEKQEFGLNTLLNKITIKQIFLGLPDPSINYYLEYDPILKNNNVFRFTDELQEEIFKQNHPFYKNSKQNIKNSKFFYDNRISDYLKARLIKNGIKIETDEILKQKQIEKLSSYISKKFSIAKNKAKELINNILSEAFDHKYSKYDYKNDVRSINTNWSQNFNNIYKKTTRKILFKSNILNVGVGSGQEASTLFEKCNNITFIDIAPNGLKNIKKIFPLSETINTRAEDLSMINDNSYDLYVSLRTYNSSFFDIKKAIKEAYRVLKNNSVVIISISNGFLDTNEKKIIPGIIIPKLNYVDLYRGIDIAKDLSNTLSNYGFTNIKFIPTNGELFISAKVKKSKER